MANTTIESNVSILSDRTNDTNGKPGLATEQLRFKTPTLATREAAALTSRKYRFAKRERDADETLIAPAPANLAATAAPVPNSLNDHLPVSYSAKSNALQKAGPAAFYSGRRLIGREIEGLWNEILLLRRQNNAQVIGFASARSGEGTTTILANLALSNNEFEWPVLLVDLNVVHPQLADLFACAPAPGFTDLLEKRCKFPVASRTIVANKLYLLPLGYTEKEGGLNWEITARALFMLKEYFGLILVDLPPMSENPQALHLTCATDGVIQVVQAETTRLESVKAVKQQLERLNVRLFGTVLNRRQFHIPKFLYKNF
ncbi:MAG: tyrosine-protein kinase family protein [bacterium]